MRVLLLDDGVWNDRHDDQHGCPAAERWMRDLAGDLRAAGCQVGCVPGPSAIERDVSKSRAGPGHSAAAPLDFPRLSGGQTDAGNFTQLPDAAIAAYRQWLRVVLDRAVDEFAPDVIHASHIWLPGHLALEAGVPYVLSTWGDELPVYRADARFRPLIEQAAENASRIVADSEATRQRVLATFDLEAAIVTTPSSNQTGLPVAWLIAVYQQAIDTRRTASPPR